MDEGSGVGVIQAEPKWSGLGFWKCSLSPRFLAVSATFVLYE